MALSATGYLRRNRQCRWGRALLCHDYIVIGTLNEGSLHAQLKAWYAQPGDRPEQPVDGYVVDLVRDELLIEIQTGGFSPLKTKLGRLLVDHPVRLVAPIAGDRRIVKLTADGEVLSIRRSPRHGRVEDIFSRLVSLSLIHI